MNVFPKPLRFGHHALAVLGATMLGSTVFSLIWTTALAVTANSRLPGSAWLAEVACIFWLGFFMIDLPSAGFVLSLLFPITLRRTAIANSICLGAGATMGVILAPLASPKFHGATLLQILAFALIGAVIAGLYLMLVGWFSRNAGPITAPFTPDRRSQQFGFYILHANVRTRNRRASRYV